MLPFHQIQSWVLAWGNLFLFCFLYVFVTNNENRNETYADKIFLNKSLLYLKRVCPEGWFGLLGGPHSSIHELYWKALTKLRTNIDKDLNLELTIFLINIVWVIENK